MKKIFPNNDSIISWGKGFQIILLGVILLFDATARASPELDRQFELGTVGVLKSWDNVDGLFTEYVASAYEEFFSHQSRFLMSDLSKADSILVKSKLPYNKVIADLDILGQVARSTRSASILRTQIQKVNSKYTFTLEWFHAPLLELMSTVHFDIEEPAGGKSLGSDDISKIMKEHLEKLISQVPFMGQVSGRDGSAVTVNIGTNAHIKKGDTLLIGTLDLVKKHPLLKTIVDWHFSPVGRVIVEQVDEKMSFCKVLEEFPEKEITSYQKVTEIQSAAMPEEPATPTGTPGSKSITPVIEEAPKLGWVSSSLFMGSFSNQFSSTALSVSNSGGGSLLGGNAAGELWLTREWFSNLQFAYSFWNFTQQDTNTALQSPVSLNGGVSGSALSFKFNVGYSYLVTGELMGPRLWGKFGYKSNSYSLPSNATENTGSVGINSFFIGIGGDAPVHNEFGVRVDLNFRLLTSVKQNLLPTDTVSSSSDVGFALGGYYRYTSRLTFRLGLELEANGADFASGASISQKTVTFGPTVLYYF